MSYNITVTVSCPDGQTVTEPTIRHLTVNDLAFYLKTVPKEAPIIADCFFVSIFKDGEPK